MKFLLILLIVSRAFANPIGIYTNKTTLIKGEPLKISIVSDSYTTLFPHIDNILGVKVTNSAVNSLIQTLPNGNKVFKRILEIELFPSESIIIPQQKVFIGDKIYYTQEIPIQVFSTKKDFIESSYIRIPDIEKLKTKEEFRDKINQTIHVLLERNIVTETKLNELTRRFEESQVEKNKNYKTIIMEINRLNQKLDERIPTPVGTKITLTPKRVIRIKE